jgi:hypothetical protein
MKEEMSPEAKKAVKTVEGKTIAQLRKEYAKMGNDRTLTESKASYAEAARSQDVKFKNDPHLEAIVKQKIQPVFDLFGVSDSVVKIWDTPQPNAADLFGAGIMISPALLHSIKNDGELISIVAHELAHKFFWKMSYLSKMTGAVEINKTVEMMCDAVAARAMLELGINPHFGGTIMTRTDSPKMMTLLSQIMTGEQSDHPESAERVAIFEHFAKQYKAK